MLFVIYTQLADTLHWTSTPGFSTKAKVRCGERPLISILLTISVSLPN